MRTILTPALAKLINIGKEAALGSENSEALLAATGEAAQFLSTYRALYRLMATTFYRDKDTRTLLDYIETNFNELEKDIADLDRVVREKRTFELNPVMHYIEESSGRLISAIRELKDLDAREKVESPMPVVNAIIKASFNVASGNDDTRVLGQWFPSLVVLVSSLDGEVARFSTLHPGEEDLARTARKLVGDLKEGTGALFFYLKDKKPVCLADGLRLLKYASRNLYRILREMDRIAASTSQYSKIPAVEEFCQAYAAWKEGKMPWEPVEGSFKTLTFLKSLYDETHDAIKDFPLFFTLGNAWAAAQICRIHCGGLHATLSKSIASQQKDIPPGEVTAAFESYSSAISRLVTLMEEEIMKVASAPHIEEMKELVGRALKDGVVLEYFAQRLQFFEQSHLDILGEFSKAKDTPGSAPEVGEVFGLLTEQGRGIERMLRFLDDGGRDHLVEGLAMIEKTLPRLLEIQRGVKSEISERLGSTRPQKLFCLKCGTENAPGTKRCRKCSTPLPLVVAESYSTDDTLGMEEGSPFNIARIEEAVTQFESGSLSAGELSGEIKSYINKLEGIRSDFESRSHQALAASPSAEIREYTASFHSNLNQLRQSLETMLLFTQSPDFLYQGMQAFQAAAAELSDIRRAVRARV
ncbi:MAG: hypothetical protein RDV48_14850 [Candidatus Eremiobacteraeota bacterium]|nr:hypothetical protein [Candidatus Eremiobacteraeota bacterium]